MSIPPKDADRNRDAPAPPDRKGRDRRARRQDWLGEKLRDLYGSYAQEPVPDELRSLLERLDDDKPGGQGKGN